MKLAIALLAAVLFGAPLSAADLPNSIGHPPPIGLEGPLLGLIQQVLDALPQCDPSGIPPPANEVCRPGPGGPDPGQCVENLSNWLNGDPLNTMPDTGPCYFGVGFLCIQFKIPTVLAWPKPGDYRASTGNLRNDYGWIWIIPGDQEYTGDYGLGGYVVSLLPSAARGEC
ncbi:MAG: hypothetical protein V4510_13320 [bacterium]